MAPTKYPLHHCDPDNPCPVLVGVCEGPDPKKWARPVWLNVIEIDKEVR